LSFLHNCCVYYFNINIFINVNFLVTNYKSPDAARKQILQDWGSASVVYEKSFNVTLGLIKMEILDQNCPKTVDPKFPFNRPCEDPYTINDRLSDFSQWRGGFRKYQNYMIILLVIY
jgi:hypothetical protein